ncbi:DUF6214 family protein [Streptomyces axinellae]|uniref:DUF6214 family protein n=1 Tax=Streptomyces axinellae TaxID=552788 RepID=UPI0031D9CEB9
MSERSAYSSNCPYETDGFAPRPDAPAQQPGEPVPQPDAQALWPVWEVRGYGSGARRGAGAGAHGTAGEASDPAPGADPDLDPSPAPDASADSASGLPGDVPRGPGSGDGLPPWFEAGLRLPDGAGVEVLAVVVGGGVRLEELRADPPLTLRGFARLAAWIGEPLEDVCPPAIRPPERGPTVWATGTCVLRSATPEPRPRARTRPPAPRGQAARRAAAEAYRQAQERGQDPVLAVMGATGHSRRKSLRVIAGARDAGLLTPRHARRR